MAGKKPAKPMAGQSKTVVLDPKIYGTLVRFVGSKNAVSECSECSRVTVRGMIRLKESGKHFCSVRCATQDFKKSESETVLDN